MKKRNIIVIGASTGGFEALKKIISSLPVDFPASIFIVWHMSPEVKGILPDVLNKLGTVPASNAVDGEPIKPNHIYVAPPDHHMIIEEDKIRVTHGPKENLFRPAIDPLFRSAAYTYRNSVIGVILSGGLDDGSSGLWRIKANGGVVLVQDPNDAQEPSMPKNALKAVDVDFCLPINEITECLIHLSNQEIEINDSTNSEDEQTQAEIAIAAEESALKFTSLGNLGKLSPYSCPDCHGVLSAIMEDDLIRYRCHTGHAYSANSLLQSLSEKTEQSLYNVIRVMEETAFLLNHMGDHHSEANEPKLAGAYFKQANKTLEQSNVLRKMVYSGQTLNIDKFYADIKQQVDSKSN